MMRAVRRKYISGTILTVVPALLFFLSWDCSAGFVAYQDRPTFIAAAPSTTLVDFENFGVTNSFFDASAVAFPSGPFGPTSINQSGAKLSSFGVTGGYLSASGPVVTETRSAVNVFGPNYLGYKNAGSAYYVSEIVRSTLIFQFNSSQTSVGLDVGTLIAPFQPGPPVHIVGSTGPLLGYSTGTFELVFDFHAEGSYSATFDQWKFVGFLFDHPITSFSISFADGPESALSNVPNSGNYIGVDNLLFNDDSSTAPVPEPSTLALLGIGGIGIAVAAYRRRLAA